MDSMRQSTRNSIIMIRNQHVFHFMERVKENFKRTNFRALAAHVRRERMIKSHVKGAMNRRSSRLLAVWLRASRLRRARRRVLRKTVVAMRRSMEAQALRRWHGETR